MDATDLDHKIVDLFFLKTGYTYREKEGRGGGGWWRGVEGEVGAYRFFWNLTT